MTSSMPETGKTVLNRLRLGAPDQCCASPVAANGNIYASSVNGIVAVFRAGDALEVLARNDPGDTITATPAIAGNNLHIRTSKYLWAFGEQR